MTDATATGFGSRAIGASNPKGDSRGRRPIPSVLGRLAPSGEDGGVDHELGPGLVQHGEAVVVELQATGAGVVEDTAGRCVGGDVVGGPQLGEGW